MSGDVLATATADGVDYRVTLMREESPEFPDWDDLGTVLYLAYDARTPTVETRHYGEAKVQARDLVASVIDALALPGIGRDWDKMARYLAVPRFGHVVSFDTLDTSHGTYLALVTADDVAAWGVLAENVAGLAANALAVVEQWCDGDVWGYAVEECQTCRNESTGETWDVWATVDTGPGMGSMYGEEYAVTEAVEGFRAWMSLDLGVRSVAGELAVPVELAPGVETVLASYARKVAALT